MTNAHIRKHLHFTRNRRKNDCPSADVWFNVLSIVVNDKLAHEIKGSRMIGKEQYKQLTPGENRERYVWTRRDLAMLFSTTVQGDQEGL